MFDTRDADFAALLDRFIQKTLVGDENTHGLYRTLLGAPAWDQFQCMRGQIMAYEAVRVEMQNIVKRMNDDHVERVDGHGRRIN